jgi:hypothetical protein
MTDLPNHDDDSPLDPWTLEGLLDGDEPVAGDVAAPLAGLIAAARRPGDAVELRAEAQVLAAFRDGAIVAPEEVGTSTRRISMLSTMTRSKLVVAATAGALALGATSAAAYSNVLPDSLQSAAHKLINAPAPHGVGPDATGPAAKGLCTAFTAHEKSGATPSSSSVAFRNLAAAAGGEENVAAYCAEVLSPTASPTESPTGSPTESPTATPTDSATATPTGSATEEPTSEPTTAPTTAPTSSAPRAKGQSTTHPGQGAAQWTSHGRTGTFPGKGASHWPKATGKPGKAKGKPTTAPTTAPTVSPSETASATAGS